MMLISDPTYLIVRIDEFPLELLPTSVPCFLAIMLFLALSCRIMSLSSAFVLTSCRPDCECKVIAFLTPCQVFLRNFFMFF
jgi:hypothetical protein